MQFDANTLAWLHGIEAMEHTYGLPGPTTYDLGDEIVYSKVKWHMPNPPTEGEFVQAMDAYKVYRTNNIEYKEKRAAEYPNLGEFLDAYYWERQGYPTLMTDWIDKVTQVKQKYPKPST